MATVAPETTEAVGRPPATSGRSQGKSPPALLVAVQGRTARPSLASA